MRVEPKYHSLWKSLSLGSGYSKRSFKSMDDLEDFALSLHKPYDIVVIAGYGLKIEGAE